jgi:hypothetical protein
MNIVDIAKQIYKEMKVKKEEKKERKKNCSSQTFCPRKKKPFNFTIIPLFLILKNESPQVSLAT